MAAKETARKPKIALGAVFGRLAEKLGPLSRAMVNRLERVEAERIPLLRAIPKEQRQPALGLVLIISLVLATGFMFWYIFQGENLSKYVEVSTRLQMLSQRYSKTAQQAVLGNAPAFGQLEEARKSFADGLNVLIEGGEGAPASPGIFQDDLGALKQRWEISKKDIQALTSQQSTLVNFAQSLSEINKRNTELLDLSEQVVALLPAGTGKQLSFANQQSLWTQRMAKNANTLSSSDVIDPETAYLLGQDLRTFREVLDGLLAGNEALGIPAVSDADAHEKLLEVKEVFTGFEAQVNNIMKNMAHLVEAKRAARELFDESEKLLEMTQALTQRYQSIGVDLILMFAVLFGLSSLGSLLLLGTLTVQDARKRAKEAADESRRNQDAILRLLNEMGDLAEGDLSVQTTVTEDITGAIADSVNFAIEELRTLVHGIIRASEQVSSSSSVAQEESDGLLSAAEVQSRQIAETTEAVQQMSGSIAEVSKNAAESARVAEQSLDTARKGGDSVREAIAGMNAIRDQIQETSKRIKRLGESSQEIGEIVDLISDITEQTNVLALNAAIQAAAAGDAGRGFTVVAEEVQRLAERSAQATRRIGVIVKTIQSDTQDAVNAMEVSTQGVVQGTARSDAVGHSLAEIVSVSNELAQLIQNISLATKEQTVTAEQIVNNMQEILAVTDQTSQRTRHSAESVSQLAALADELKVSVSGFRL